MRILLTSLLTFYLALSGVTQEPNVEPRKLDFDIVPSDAMIAVTIRDLSDLKRKMISLSKQTDGQFASLLTVGATMGPSLIRDYLGLGQSLDESGSAAIVGFGVEDSFAIIMPITSIADVAKALGVNKEDLVAGKLVKSTKSDRRVFENWISVKGQHLVMGHQDAVAKTLQAGGLSKNIHPETQAIFADDDLFVTLDVAKMRELIQAGERQQNRRVFSLVPDEIVGLANEGELDRVSAGLRIANGFDGTFTFDFEGEESRKVLTKLQNQSKKCNLNGLPAGQIVVATSRSSGPESGELFRDAAEYFTSDLGNLLGIRKMIGPQHVAGLMGILDEGVQRVHVSRAALYQNEDAEQSGAFCLISILDADNAKEFIGEIRELVPVVNTSLHPDRDLDDQIDQAAIIKMVADLTAFMRCR